MGDIQERQQCAKCWVRWRSARLALFSPCGSGPARLHPPMLPV